VCGEDFLTILFRHRSGGLPDGSRTNAADDENWYTRWRRLIGPD
jgi:hypothetical protein